ncbi:MAG: glycosyltransferase family 9 protein [Bacteroidota bacterium]|jgi:ADP-heptose:LPS heptosyltransferase
MKILFIRFSSIGDIVLATPAIRCTKLQIPNAEIHFLSKRSMKEVTIANPYIDHFHYYDQNINALINDLKKENFDYIIDLHKNFRSYRIRKALRVKTYSYKKQSIQKFLLTKLHFNGMSGRHISLRSLDAVKGLGVKDDGKGLDYFIPKESEIRNDDLPLSHQLGYIAVVIGASYYTKKLPVEKLMELCRHISYPVILVGGSEDISEGNEVASADPIKIYNACGKFNLNESADIIRKAKLVVSHDTGMQYIASAFQKRILAVWGGTSPKLDVEPFYGTASLARHKNFIVPSLSCQPCSNYGTRTCPKGHFRCMLDQDTSTMANMANALIRE